MIISDSTWSRLKIANFWENRVNAKRGCLSPHGLVWQNDGIRAISIFRQLQNWKLSWKRTTGFRTQVFSGSNSSSSHSENVLWLKMGRCQKMLLKILKTRIFFFSATNELTFGWLFPDINRPVNMFFDCFYQKLSHILTPLWLIFFRLWWCTGWGWLSLSGNFR